MHPLSRRPNFGWICRILNCAASILHSRVILRAAIGCGLSLSLIQLPAEKENLKGTYFERVHEIITSILSNLFNLWNICFFPKRILRTASSSSNGDWRVFRTFWKIWSHLIFLNLTPHSIQTKVTLTTWEIEWICCSVLQFQYLTFFPTWSERKALIVDLTIKSC